MLMLSVLVSGAYAIEETVHSSAKSKPTVAVITDINHRAGTIYVVTGASTDIIASDIITELNNSKHVYAPVLGDSMQKVASHMNIYTKTFFDEYKYNYNIDFINLRRVTRNLHADYLLMVTSGLDVQSNFLKDTFWNKLAIAGQESVRPSYRLTTLITLINLHDESIIWQELYKKDISANDYDIGNVQFAPSYAQLSKIKKYSKNIAAHVTPEINIAINPALAPKKEKRLIELKKKDLDEDTRFYYPSINKDKLKEQKDNFIENVNNFTPKMPESNDSYFDNPIPAELEDDVLPPNALPQNSLPQTQEIKEDYPKMLDSDAPKLKPAVEIQESRYNSPKKQKKKNKTAVQFTVFEPGNVF